MSHNDPIHSPPRVDPRHFGWHNTGGEPLYLGGLTGYRYWRISEEGWLKSVSQGYTWERADIALKASCLLQNLPSSRKHPAPDGDCRCGFYAWYTPEEARRNHMNSGYGITNSYFPYSGGNGILVLGAAFASGLIVPGTEGMRAETVQPLGVVITTIKHKSRVMRFQQKYPSVKVFPSSDALVKHFPPEKDIPWRKSGTDSSPSTLYYISDDKIEGLTDRELIAELLAARSRAVTSSRLVMAPNMLRKILRVSMTEFSFLNTANEPPSVVRTLLGIPLQLQNYAEGILLEEV